ncbi:DotA/TraY family protein [Desulfuromonas acetoxidans]|uniref:DotA/TraY family protein n=1 Tax=Desulfuromonas acetoxidans (strain DSM 684 / 11070) TaxID=281689 RepID=Q1K2Y9_DESA6|nr:DotA/TraY family protein [Desulfuromonas acetoxidans]EAT16742.1 hypothetical protein Dace_1994 [Desulfuromonas acetoxidans DSM 684]NVD23682.1 DotA/TraY family protein [Desulfuromonas acetoxidans]NVE15933.1 DotA/TraY family protein [Desulfuromonas acetoxidans]
MPDVQTLGTQAESTAQTIIQQPDIVLTPPDQDIAVHLVSRWFGEGWHNLLNVPAGTAGGSEVLYAALKAFNLVLFSCVVVILLYTIGTGLVGSSQTGETMGRKYNSFWTSIRSCFAFVSLAPIPAVKGLCLMQLMVLSLTYMSFGGASWIHSATMDQLQNSGGVLYYTDTSLQHTEELGQHLLSAMVLQQERAFDYTQENAQIPPAVMTVDTIESEPDEDGTRPANHRLQFVTITQKTGFLSDLWAKFTDDKQTINNQESTDSQVLGTVLIDCPTGQDSEVCQARLEAVSMLVADLQEASTEIVESITSSTALSASEVRRSYELALNNYILRTRDAIPAAMEKDQDSFAKEVADYAEAAKELGWASSGWYYWSSLRLNQKANERINQGPVIESPIDIDRLVKTDEDQETYTMASQQIATIMATRTDATELAEVAFNTAQSSGFWGYLSGLLGPSNSMGLSVLFDPIEALSEGQEPLLYLQSKGHQIINGIVGLYVAKVTYENFKESIDNSVIGKAAGAVAGFAGKIPGFGLMAKAISPFLKAALSVASLLALPLLIVGLTWAYYLPIIPYIFFTMAVIGVLIQFAEAMVAAPLWAAAHALPEGDGLAGERAKQGYLLFFSVLLRPPLLMIGFVFSIVMLNGIGKYLAEGFQIYTAGLAAGQLSGAITYTATTVIFTVVMVLALQKLFSLITWLPDNVIRWIGQGAASLGEQASVDKGGMIFAGAMHQGVSAPGSTSAANKAAGTAAGQAGGMVKKRNE